MTDGPGEHTADESNHPVVAAGRGAVTEGLRRTALSLVEAGIEAADPQILVPNYLRTGGADAWRWLTNTHRLHVLGIGKAAHGMVAGALAQLAGRRIERGLIVGHVPLLSDQPGFAALVADHPMPGKRSVVSARRAVRLVQSLTDRDGLLVLISGGASALLALPAEGLTLADKVQMTGLLLAGGLPIEEINAVRKHVSQIKGGRLAQLAAPAKVLVLVLSDVPGGNPGVVGSGPFSPDPTSFRDAVSLLDRSSLWSRLPQAVRGYLTQGLTGGVDETPKPGAACFQSVMVCEVGGNTVSVRAMAAQARRDGFDTPVLPVRLKGEARQAAEGLVATAERAIARGPGSRLAILAGGETTVTVQGAGQGGRNQELALAFAVKAEQARLPGRWALASCGSDGRDGPTDVAGGLVDPGSLARMRSRGLDPLRALADNDSHRALAASGDLLRTGVTGTNVADLAVLLIAGETALP